MQLGRGNNNRGGARGQPSTRSRGSRGRGSTSRGALSSSKLKHILYSKAPSISASDGRRPSPSGLAPKTLKDKTNAVHGSDRGSYKGKNSGPRLYKETYSRVNIGTTDTTDSTKSASPFERERLENAAKREQRGGYTNTGILNNGRGRGRGGSLNKSVRFANPALGESGSKSNGQTSSANLNPFGSPATNTSPFGAPSNGAPSNPFGALTKPSTSSTSISNPFGSPNPFASTAKTPAAAFGSSTSSTATFGSPSISKPFTSASASTAPVYGFGAQSAGIQNKHQATAKGSNNGTSGIEKFLKGQGITPPAWPKEPGNPKQKSAMEAIYHAHKKYQAKARSSLRKAGMIDDPEVPKGLDDAIAFNGTCEEMCPEFEKITRIVEHNVPNPEKEDAPDGSRWPAPEKMVKAMARSAAGQEPALPEEVRTPAALRRTFDYLMHTVLGDDGDLRKVHGFLWDRTRGIRRDFTLQVASINPEDLQDYIYCLEGIARFHTIALHQMSKVSDDGIVAEGFVEQQEVEQLGKTLKSLIEAYDDCKAWGITCANEFEFRAYYLVHNSHASNTLEQVQNWGIQYWKSDHIQNAVHFVEALQNTWDPQGPLNPSSATEVALNSFSNFFSMVQDKATSYTMACLLETKFNDVRMAALKTILSAYRKQREQTRDWTLSKLNEYLQFDDEEEIITFCEAYHLRFEESDGEYYLSFDSDPIEAPFPRYKQQYSEYLVEHKRGTHTLPQTIDQTVYDESPDEEGLAPENGINEEEPMFVSDAPVDSGRRDLDSKRQNPAENDLSIFGRPTQQDTPPSTSPFNQSTTFPSQPVASGSSTTPQLSLDGMFGTRPTEAKSSVISDTSIFSQKPPQKTFADIFKAPIGTEKSPLSTPGLPDFSSLFKPKTAASATSSTPIGSPMPSFTFGSTPSPGLQTAAQKLPETTTHPQTSSVQSNIKAPSSIFGSATVGGLTATGTPLNGSVLAQSASATSAGEIPKSQPMLGSHEVGTATTLSAPQSLAPLESKVASIFQQPSISQEGSQSSPGPKPISSSPFASIDASSQVPALATDPPPTISREKRMEGFTDWFALGDGGIIDQFTEFGVNEVLRLTMEKYKKEEMHRRAKQAAKQARKDADEFRYQHLASKYCQMWRDNAHRLWMKRKGRAARKARQEMAESHLRASQAAKSADVVDEFRSSASRKRRSLKPESTDEGPVFKKPRSKDVGSHSATGPEEGPSTVEDDQNTTATKRRLSSLESLIRTTGVLDGTHAPDDLIRKIVREEVPHTNHKRHKSSRSTASRSSSLSTQKQDDPLRRSLMSDPSYLLGGSRIHLMETYRLDDERRRQPSGVQTDYFRLKARGISTLPDGTALASSVAKKILHSKRSFDDISQTTPRPTRPELVARSVPSKLASQPEKLKTSAERISDIQELKARAKALMVEENESRLHKKKSLDFDEEELFAKARRVREQMDEGARWYKEEVERSRSAS
ncbi:hypothetical protein BP6252_01580 [Coleophoma cylindrospora]|uniref:SAC3/GANP/THP3 conserved domain-containing protein n=1 Tax=Coleophoma cylindrospora TaxID=1849047 RepID=A0A3D8SUT6_9HELO|nr:hypothetical protein BP6252_01580 [Coleophoma cylindrospora]